MDEFTLQDWQNIMGALNAMQVRGFDQAQAVLALGSKVQRRIEAEAAKAPETVNGLPTDEQKAAMAAANGGKPIPPFPKKAVARNGARR